MLGPETSIDRSGVIWTTAPTEPATILCVEPGRPCAGW